MEFLRTSDLEVGVAYEVKNMSKAKTKYGHSLVATIQVNARVGKIFLPKRFFSDTSDDEIKKMNQSPFKVGLVFLGVKNTCNNFHFVNFRNYGEGRRGSVISAGDAAAANAAAAPADVVGMDVAGRAPSVELGLETVEIEDSQSPDLFEDSQRF